MTGALATQALQGLACKMTSVAIIWHSSTTLGNGNTCKVYLLTKFIATATNASASGCKAPCWLVVQLALQHAGPRKGATYRAALM
jgi:hypothetical protein